MITASYVILAASNVAGATFGYLLGGIGKTSGQQQAFGAVGGATSTIFSPCADSGIPSQDPNGGKTCFSAAGSESF